MVPSNLKKIVACVEMYEKDNDQATLKRIKKYGEDGITYFRKKLKKEEESVTPIEQEKQSADLFFVNQQREEFKDSFRWKKCYEEGVKKGLFQSLGSALSLKSTYFNKRL